MGRGSGDVCSTFLIGSAIHYKYVALISRDNSQKGRDTMCIQVRGVLSSIAVVLLILRTGETLHIVENFFPRGSLRHCQTQRSHLLHSTKGPRDYSIGGKINRSKGNTPTTRTVLGKYDMVIWDCDGVLVDSEALLKQGEVSVVFPGLKPLLRAAVSRPISYTIRKRRKIKLPSRKVHQFLKDFFF